MEIDSCFQSEDFKKQLAIYRKANYWRGFRVGAGLVFLLGVVPLVVVLQKIYNLVLTLE